MLCVIFLLIYFNWRLIPSQYYSGFFFFILFFMATLYSIGEIYVESLLAGQVGCLQIVASKQCHSE